MTPEIKRGSCESCPAFDTNHGQPPRCYLGRATRAVNLVSDLTGDGFRPTIAPANHCRRPKSRKEMMELLRITKP